MTRPSLSNSVCFCFFNDYFYVVLEADTSIGLHSRDLSRKKHNMFEDFPLGASKLNVT